VTTAFAQNIIFNSTSPAQPHTLLGLVTHSAASAETPLSAEVNYTLNTLQSALSPLIGANQTDIRYLDSLAALPNTVQARDGESPAIRVYMAAVSPWFFTHYGADSFNRNFIYLSAPILEEMGVNHQSTRSSYLRLHFLPWRIGPLNYNNEYMNERKIYNSMKDM